MQTTTKPPRVMIFVESEKAFGHFNVTNEIIKQITAQGGEVALVSGSMYRGKGSFDFEKSGAQLYSLPEVVGRSTTPKDATTGENYDGKFVSARQAAVTAACEDFKPDTILFEMFPFQTHYREHDAEAAKQWADKQPHPIPFVSLTRDITHSQHPDFVSKMIDRYFPQHLLVRGDGRIQLGDTMAEWKNLTPTPNYTGNIIAPMPPATSLPDAPVVVFSGGGYIPNMDRDFFENAIKSYPHTGALSNQPWHIYVAAQMTREEFTDLQALAHSVSEKISIHRVIDSDKFRQELADCRLCITRAGYNTTCELSSLNKPMVVVPRIESVGFREQTQRAKYIENQGWGTFVEQTVDAQTLGAAVVAEFQRTRESVPSLQNSGATNIASYMMNLARSAKSPEAPTADGAEIKPLRDTQIQI